MTTTNNPFELLTDDKDKANAMRISAYMAMLLAKRIKDVGREDAAKMLGVSQSRVSRLANRSGSGMTIDVMLLSLMKLGAVVNAEMVWGDDSTISGCSLTVA